MCASMCVFLCWLDSTYSVSSLFSLTHRGNKPSLFLFFIYPCHVLEEPPGMPLQWFVLFGLEYTSEVWQGKVEPERNDGKGLAMTKESARGLNIPHVNNSVGECLRFVLALFSNLPFTSLCLRNVLWSFLTCHMCYCCNSIFPTRQICLENLGLLMQDKRTLKFACAVLKIFLFFPSLTKHSESCKFSFCFKNKNLVQTTNKQCEESTHHHPTSLELPQSYSEELELGVLNCFMV